MPAITLPVALLISAIIAGVTATASTGAAIYNTNKQEEWNNKNIAFQKEVNEQQQYNLEHQHQIEMNDLKAAGLNPVLTTSGGSGSGTVNLDAPEGRAPQLDLSGVSSALGAMSQTMMMSAMMSERNSVLNEKNTILAQKNEMLQQRLNDFKGVNSAKAKFYNAKTTQIKSNLNFDPELGRRNIHSAKNLSQKWTAKDEKEWNKIMKDLGF